MHSFHCVPILQNKCPIIAVFRLPMFVFAVAEHILSYAEPVPCTLNLYPVPDIVANTRYLCCGNLACDGAYSLMPSFISFDLGPQ